MQIIAGVVVFTVLVVACVGGVIAIADDLKGFRRSFRAWNFKRKAKKWFK